MTVFEKFKKDAFKIFPNETEEVEKVLKNLKVHECAVGFMREQDKCDVCNFNSTGKCTKNIQTKNPQDNCVDGVMLFLNSEVSE